MSERWKPKQVHRMMTPETRAAAREASNRRAMLVNEHQRQRRIVNGVARVVHCSHGVNWLDCTLCSKPKR